MADEVWLSEKDAIEALKQSDWGKLRLPHVTERINPLDSIASLISTGQMERTIYGLSPQEKARRKHAMFLELTLRSFAETNPAATRTVDGRAEYERGALLRFLDLALNEELLSEFGQVPSYKVT